MSRSWVRMTLLDALHYDETQRELVNLSYPKHVRRARSMGLPAIGEGAVYPIEDEAIACEPFEIPRHWREIGGLDFGWDHPTAAARLAYDPDTEIFYLTNTYRKRQQTPLYHCQHLLPWGKHLPFAWGLEGQQTKLSDDPKKQFKMFRKHGLKMLDSHATFEEGGVGLEQGVQEILQLMETGRFKVFKHLHQFFEEKNSYHRHKNDDDKVAKIKPVHDDILDAVRYAYMMIRYAVYVWRREQVGIRGNRKVAFKDTRDIFDDD